MRRHFLLLMVLIMQLLLLNWENNHVEKGVEAIVRFPGFIPTGVYPSSIAILNSKWMYVCNLEGTGKHVADKDKNSQNTVYNSHELMASVSVIKMPGKKALRAYTDTVIAVNDLQRATSSLSKPRENTPPIPVPERGWRAISI